MKRALNVFLGLAVFSPLLLTASSSKAYGIADETILSRTQGNVRCAPKISLTAD